MDILAPQLYWIKNRCYRLNSTQDTNENNKFDPSGYTENDLYGSEDENDEDYEIEMTDNNRFKTSFHVPSVFFAQIIGTKGMTRKRIESETKAQIKVPRPGEQGPITVVGSTHQSVVAARRRIEIIVIAARNKQQFTHFLSVPFHNDNIKANFIKFRDSILQGRPVYGLDSSLFQHPNKLHLTICTMSLMDNEDRSSAAQILQDCDSQIIKPILSRYGRIHLEMIGVEYMNDDPASVDVLYGKVYSEPLQEIADQINEYFIRKGLTQPKHDHVKMHVTLINSLFRDENINIDDSEKFNKTSRKTFDAREILDKFKDFYFGKFELNEIHLSQRYSTACDGYYQATGILKI